MNHMRSNPEGIHPFLSDLLKSCTENTVFNPLLKLPNANKPSNQTQHSALHDLKPLLLNIQSTGDRPALITT